jgi:hypothetical protein
MASSIPWEAVIAAKYPASGSSPPQAPAEQQRDHEADDGGAEKRVRDPAMTPHRVERNAERTAEHVEVGHDGQRGRRQPERAAASGERRQRAEHDADDGVGRTV